jgi:hypothetical protein
LTAWILLHPPSSYHGNVCSCMLQPELYYGHNDSLFLRVQSCISKPGVFGIFISALRILTRMRIWETVRMEGREINTKF